MKQFTFVLVFVSLALVCSAGDQRENLEFGAALPCFIEAQETSGVDVKRNMHAFAINFSGVSFFADTIGLGVYINLIFPRQITISALGQSVSVDRSDYDFLAAMDTLIGLTFMVYKNDKLALPLSVGIHYLYLWSLTDTASSKGSEFGLGANITGQYYVHPKVYLFARFQLTLDLLAAVETEQFEPYTGYDTYSRANTGGLMNWGINPTLGMGFSW
ncbi:MAG: hypothetical protein LBK63_12280 [Treponema sp.]|jgi:hypothetical protein|nr:hypothetical protein [Treponema sp.]